MDELGSARALADAALTAYRGVLGAVHQTAAVISGDENPAIQERLEVIRFQLNSDPSARTIEQSGTAVAQELADFTQQRRYVQDKKERELKQVVGIAAQAMALIVQNGCLQGQELVELATKIESTSLLHDLTKVREELSQRIEEVRAVAKRTQESAAAQTKALEGEIQRAKERLAVLEQLTETDPLTGLGNRRLAESAIRTLIVARTPFSILLFDLDNFKAVNDTHGHQQGDQVLQLLAREIKRAVRDSDVICRWGGDEFVVLLTGANLATATAKATAIQASVSGEFLFASGQGKLRLKISASVGVAEYREGEDPFDFFERADRLMYARKSQRRQVPETGRKLAQNSRVG